MDFALPVDHRIKLKECEKKDKYRDLARELKKLWNMKMTIVPIVIGAFGTITRGLLKSLEELEVGGRVETIQMIALLRTDRILRRVLETWRDLLSLKPSANTDVTLDELRQMDQRTRKLMTMHEALHLRDDMDRLYVSRKDGGRGLSSIEVSVDASIQRLEDYIEKHERGLITAIRNNTDNTIDSRMTKTRKQKWDEK